MTAPRFAYDPMSEAAAHEAAQRLAFGPLLFQAVRLLASSGLLGALRSAADAGAAPEDLGAPGLSPYAVSLLLEAGHAAGVVAPHEGRYRITKVGLALLGDGAARVNVAFVHDVCYLGAHRLEDSLREARPAGLEALVAASSTATPPPATVYEALAHLPAAVRRSWFAFDHFYSDRAFPAALPRLLARSPRHLLDVGGNTGRFALLALAASPALRVTVADLPGQLAEAEAAFVAAGVGERTALAPVDLLDPHAALPKGADAVWMSQLLSCFSLRQATGILRRAREAVAPGGRVFVLDTPWDQQRTAVARLCLQATSVYFACIANGQSKMHGAAELRACVAEAGLTLEEEATGLGASHTLWICR